MIGFAHTALSYPPDWWITWRTTGSLCVLRLVELFARPCARSTTAAQRRDSGPPPGLSAEAPSSPLPHPCGNSSSHDLHFAQVSGTYGRAEAQTIVENCGNTLILRYSASEGGGTARFASGLIGEREIIREQITKSRRPNEWLASESIARHHVTESAVLASEIEQLPDLQGFLKFASQPEWKRVKLSVGGE